jgi:hypothetical protein
MPHKRLFRFYISVDDTAVPESIKNVFSPEVKDYFFGFAVADEGGRMAHKLEDGWERVPMDGIMNFPLSTVGSSLFGITVLVVPNSKVDPDASESLPLWRRETIGTNDFVPVKASKSSDLVKSFPDGFFSLQLDLVTSYVPITVRGPTTFEAELSQAGIRPQDIVYHAMNPIWDDAGTARYVQHHVIYWSDGLHLSGRKYVP